MLLLLELEWSNSKTRICLLVFDPLLVALSPLLLDHHFHLSFRMFYHCCLDLQSALGNKGCAAKSVFA